ncbi:IS110 family transposase [Halobacillus sp. MO56]
MSQLLVGIDVSLKSHHVHFMKEDGASLQEFSIPNNQEGARLLLQKVMTYREKAKVKDVKVGLEATSNYGWHLAHFLHDHLCSSDDESFSPAIYVLNARKVSRFKKGYDTLPKNDRIDAWVIADHLRFGRLPHAMKEVAQYEALQRLTRTRFHLVKDIARHKTYIMNQVFLKFSGITQESPFSNTFGVTSMAVIQELEPEVIAQMSLEELMHFIQEKGNNQFREPEEAAKFLKKIARDSFRLHPNMEDAVNVSLSIMASTIQHLTSQVKRLDKEIQKVIKAIPETLTSIKGIGPVYSAGLIAEIGDIQRFKDHHALAKYAGLVWNQHQSGEYESESTSRMRTGNKYLRYYLIQAADTIRKHDSEYRAFYLKKFHEVPKHQHKRALVLTARKLIRLVYSLRKTNQLYLPPERRNS